MLSNFAGWFGFCVKASHTPPNKKIPADKRTIALLDMRGSITNVRPRLQEILSGRASPGALPVSRPFFRTWADSSDRDPLGGRRWSRPADHSARVGPGRPAEGSEPGWQGGWSRPADHSARVGPGRPAEGSEPGWQVGWSRPADHSARVGPGRPAEGSEPGWQVGWSRPGAHSV